MIIKWLSKSCSNVFIFPVLKICFTNAYKTIKLHYIKTLCKIVSYIFQTLSLIMYFPFIHMDHYLSTRCLFEGVLYYAIIGYTIALCTLSIQRLLIDNIENDINVALVVAHKRHICRSGLKRVKVLVIILQNYTNLIILQKI